jgi:uncharacterized metal-binding protein
VALNLDREATAEMSCIAGVGGGVTSLVRIANSGRRIVALDGCALGCVKQALARHGVRADVYCLLSGDRVDERRRADFDPADADRVFASLRSLVRGRPALAAGTGHAVSETEAHAESPA